jgi:hypothetical protein
VVDLDRGDRSASLHTGSTTGREPLRCRRPYALAQCHVAWHKGPGISHVTSITRGSPSIVMTRRGEPCSDSVERRTAAPAQAERTRSLNRRMPDRVSPSALFSAAFRWPRRWLWPTPASVLRIAPRELPGWQAVRVGVRDEGWRSARLALRSEEEVPSRERMGCGGQPTSRPSPIAPARC